METYKIFLIEQTSQRIIWSLNLDKIELLAGMLAAGIGISDDLNIDSTDSGNIYYFDSDADVSSYRLFVDVIEDELDRRTTGRKLFNPSTGQNYILFDPLQPNEFGIWMKSQNRFYYNLYAFKSNVFFQGVVSICNIFQVDFRNYIYGFPFDRYGKQYSLQNYVMAPYQIGQDAFDIDDNEEEEESDENIIEVLARTEEIITIKD